MTTRQKVIDALWAMGDWGEHRAGEVYDALVAAGVVIVDETPQPPLEPKLTITEPMPPSMIEAIEGTVWLAEHDAAIREGIATAIVARAAQVYPPDVFVPPTGAQYAEINALLKRERGHMLDGITGDVMRRAHAGIVHEIRDDFDGFMARAALDTAKGDAK